MPKCRQHRRLSDMTQPDDCVPYRFASHRVFSLNDLQANSYPRMRDLSACINLEHYGEELLDHEHRTRGWDAADHQGVHLSPRVLLFLPHILIRGTKHFTTSTNRWIALRLPLEMF